jgi:lysophospholipase L1-like esterase
MLDVSVENHAVVGAKMADILKQLTEARQQQYDYVLIQGGGNDVVRLTNAAELAGKIDAVFLVARSYAPQVIALSCGDVGNAPIFPFPLAQILSYRTRSTRQLFVNAAVTNDVLYVNLLEYPDEFSADPTRFYAADSFHPSGDGYGLWFAHVAQKITETWHEKAH